MAGNGLLSSDNLVWLVVIIVIAIVIIVLLTSNNQNDPDKEQNQPDLTWVWIVVAIVVGILILAYFFGSKTLGIDGNPDLPVVGQRGSGRSEFKSLSPARSSSLRSGGSLSPPRSSGSPSSPSSSASRSTRSAPMSRPNMNGSYRRSARTSLSSLGSLSPQ